MQIEDGKFVFSSGRMVSTRGITGLSEGLELYDGYDSNFHYVNYDTGDELTIDDVRELADHMIERWTKFRDSLTPEWAEQHGL